LKRILSIIAAFLMITVILAGCNSTNNNPAPKAAKKSKVLVVYSGRKEPLILPVIKKFEEKTGIKVILHSGNTPDLANAILEERKNPQADVFIGQDAGTLEMLNMEGVLLANSSEAIRQVDPRFKAKTGAWVGVSARARVIMYNTELVAQKDLPKSVLDLTDPKWKGQVGIQNSSNESQVAQITAMRKALGEEATENYLRGLIANKAVFLKSSTEIRKAVGAGELKLGMLNHYYYHLQKKEGSPVGVIYPDQDGMGTIVNISGVGILKGAKNPDNAEAFVDFLLARETQKLFAELNYEIPVIEGVPVKEARPLAEIKTMDIKLEELGRELDNTLNLMEKVNVP